MSSELMRNDFKKLTNHSISVVRSPARQHSVPASCHPIWMISECGMGHYHGMVAGLLVDSPCSQGHAHLPEQHQVLLELSDGKHESSAQAGWE
jgi:hypothetical protein